MVALARLTLTDFRNYEHLMLRVGPAPVVLTGDNGAGKTNLLESVSLLAPGRGLRRAVLADCARQSGPGGWAVAAEIETPDGKVRLGTGMLAGNEPTHARQCRIDGAPVSGPGAFADHLRIVWLVPSMDRLFTGPASDRRRFLDRLAGLADPANGRIASRYDHAMAERNSLLQSGRTSPAWLDALEAQMAETGVALAAARLDALDRLGRAIAEADGGGFPPASLRIAGTLEEALGARPAVDVEDEYRAALKSARGRDAGAGRALEGPHRSDLETRHGLTGADAAQCSTGEQKALLVSIVLAKARLAAEAHGGRPAVLLLDEVAAHLDEARREALFERIVVLGSQAWMTGTDESLFSPLKSRAQSFRVSAGTVRPG